MNKFLFIIVITIVGGCSLFSPKNVLAAELTFKVITNDISNSGMATIEADIDPQSRNLNTIDGVVRLDGIAADKLTVAVLSGGSVMTFWPVQPEYSANESVIRFTGGTPVGFSQKGLLFRILISSAQPGDLVISWLGGSAYLNDGRGTKDSIIAKSLKISLNKQDSKINETLSYDDVPPKFDLVQIGSDPLTYGGKLFVSFHATDDNSGVAHYSVTEGQSVTNVTDGVYVFNNQNRTETVTITAYDMSGNESSVTIAPKSAWSKSVVTILLLVFAIILYIIIRYVYKKFIKR